MRIKQQVSREFFHVLTLLGFNISDVGGVAFAHKNKTHLA